MPAWIKTFNAVKRNFKKIAYNRFFVYKATPRVFTFKVNRLDRGSIYCSPSFTELGSGETVTWILDFVNVLTSGETLVSTPGVTIKLRNQNIAVSALVTSVTYSGTQAIITLSSKNENITTGQVFTSMLGQPTSVAGHIRLGDTPHNVQSTTIQQVGLHLGGEYTLTCLAPLSSGRNEETLLDFRIPV